MRSAIASIERMNFIRADVIDILEKFENEMKRQKDRRCRDWPQKGDLKPGKWVYLKFAALSLPITSNLPSRKQKLACWLLHGLPAIQGCRN